MPAASASDLRLMRAPRPRRCMNKVNFGALNRPQLSRVDRLEDQVVVAGGARGRHVRASLPARALVEPDGLDVERAGAQADPAVAAGACLVDRALEHLAPEPAAAGPGVGEKLGSV